VDLRRLRILAAVAEQRSIGRAARILGIAQPALSRQLKALEGVVQTTLLDRGQKGAVLTAAGRALITRAAGIDDILRDAMHRARLTAEGRLGRLRVSMGRIAVDDPRMGRALDAVRVGEPGIDLVVHELGSPRHTLALLRGETDLTIGSEESPHHRRLSRRVLDIEVVCAALVPAAHPLARRDVVEAEELAELPQLMAGGPSGWLFPQVREALRKLGCGTALEFESLETVYALVAAGRGWLPIARSYSSRPPEGTATVTLRGLEVELPLLLRWRRGDPSPVLARVSRILSRAFRANTAASVPSDGAPEASRAVASKPPVMRRIDDATEVALAARIESRHLRALLTIANDGSLADAARRLDVTQSAVSRQLASIERIIGTPLFVRTRSGATPTPAGEVMRAGAADALRIFDTAVDGARLAAMGIERRCVIGLVPSPIATDSLVSLLRRAPVELPALAIEVCELTSPQLADALRSGKVDVALMMLADSRAPDPEFESRFVANDPYDSVLVSANGPLAARTVLMGEDLNDMALCFFPRTENPRYHDSLLGEFRKLGMEPRLGVTYRGPRAMWRSVADGDAWAIGLRSMRVKPPLGVVAIPLQGFCIPASLHVVSRRAERDPHLNALVAAI
jgi:molybdate transport repressor ModE-like protein